MSNRFHRAGRCDAAKKCPRVTPIAAAVRALILGGMAAVHGGPAWALLPTPADIASAGAVTLPVPMPGGIAGFRKSGDVDLPTVNGNAMSVQQRSPKAVLDWQSFNIGKDYSVNFKQPGETAVALNRIHQADPSKIFGTLSANGQIYLVNQNGFLFGGSARVDTNTLVATTLPIDEAKFDAGLTRAVKDGAAAMGSDCGAQCPKGGIAIDSGAKLTAKEGGRILLVAKDIVNKGSIEAPGGQAILAAARDKVYLQEADSESTGVRGLLVEVNYGGKVENLGRILARRGNITLEGFAVNQKGLVSASSSVQLNGSVRLLAREKAGGPVQIDSVAGPNLLPDRTARSVALDDGLGKSARVVLGAGSTTEVLPEIRSKEKAVDEQSPVPSRVEIMGRKVEVQAGSKVSAPAGDVAIYATNRLVASPFDPAPNDPLPGSVDPEATLEIQRGAVIDVAGLKNVKAPMSRNVVEVELRSFELRDSPRQLPKDINNPVDAPLYAKKIKVDIRSTKDGRIPLADVSGGLSRIERTAAERSTTGGNIKLRAEGKVDIAPEARLDVSGGEVKYQAGSIRTTWVRSQGTLYEISKADPNRRYDGIATNRSIFEPGYVEGKDAGTIDIHGQALRLDGQVSGMAVQGHYQREPNRTEFGRQQARAGTLNIDVGFRLEAPGADDPLEPYDQVPDQSVALLSAKLPVRSQLERLRLLPAAAQPSTETAADGVQLPEPLVLLDRMLNRSGMGHIGITSRGEIKVAHAAEIMVARGGRNPLATDATKEVPSLALKGATVEVFGTLAAPSGNIALASRYTARGTGTGLDGHLLLAKGSRVDVSGQWTNDLREVGSAGTKTLEPIAADAGSVSVTTIGDLKMERGAVIAADGGGWLKSNGKLSAGRGGAISLSAGTNSPDPNQGVKANFEMSGKLHAYGLESGGALALAGNAILIGDRFDNGVPDFPERFQPLLISPNLFRNGGFSGYRLVSAVGGITVGLDTRIRLSARNLVLDDDFRSRPTGSDLRTFTRVGALDPALRKPVKLELNAVRKYSFAANPPTDTVTGRPLDGTVDLQRGSVIRTEPGGEIDLKADGRILIAGTVDAPAGKIVAELPTTGLSDLPYRADQGIFVGATGTLRSRGAVLKTLGDPDGLKDDRVLAGGDIKLTANRGFVRLDSGSLLDVSGVATVVDELKPGSGNPGVRLVPTVHAGNAGGIELSAGDGAFLQGHLLGQADRTHGAEGGRLSVMLGKYLRNPGQGSALPDDPRIIEVQHDWQPGLLDGWDFGGKLPAQLAKLEGLATVPAARIELGGFDSVGLKTVDMDTTFGTYGTDSNAQHKIRFVGNVDLSTGHAITLDTGTIELVGEPQRPVPHAHLNSSYIALGSSVVREGLPTATAGSGSLTAIAHNIGLFGAQRLEGVGQTTLVSSGDLSLRGVRSPDADAKASDVGSGNPAQHQRDFKGQFLAAGRLTMSADQIYPSTLTQFEIAMPKDETSQLVIAGGDHQGAVLSAGSSLSISAPNIIDAGVIKAPFGTIRLESTGASGSVSLLPGAVVSVSAENRTIPFGKTLGGISWLYPLLSPESAANPNTEQGNLLLGLAAIETAPPAGKVELAGARVDFQDGARIDVSGGGDLFARELKPVQGGSVDLLDPKDPKVVDGTFTYKVKYAVLPWLKNRVAPFDPNETPKSGLAVGDSVYLADKAAGLSPGTYTLLPAAYALLPGAYLVTPQTAMTQMAPGVKARTTDGTPVVAGYRTLAGTGYKDYRWQAYSIETGKQFRTRTGYVESTGSEFFAKQAASLDKAAPALPRDAGRLVIDVDRGLNLAGQVDAKTGLNGHGGQVDIAATQIRVSGATAGPASEGEVVVRAQQLNELGIESLLLGARRSENGTERQLAITSTQVKVDAGASLKAPEIILAATDRVAVGAGATIAGEGRMTSTVSTDRIKDAAGVNGLRDGAILRVSGGTQTTIVRNEEVARTGGKGALVVEPGALLSATGSLALDASGDDFKVLGGINVGPGTSGISSSMAIGAQHISLGNVPASVAGLALTDAQLNGIKADEIRLSSAGTIDTYGSVAIAASRTLSLEGWGITASGTPGAVNFKADTIRLQGTAGGAEPLAAAGAGSLSFDANSGFDFRGGNFGLDGFKDIQIGTGGTGRMSAGAGTLNSGGNLSIATPALLASSNANFAIQVPEEYGFSLRTVDPALSDDRKTALRSEAGLAGRVAVTAGTIGLDSWVLLPSGQFTAKATKGDLNLGPRAAIDVAGVTKVYAGKTVGTPGGWVNLASDQGNLNLAGGNIDLHALDRAGELSVSAPKGTLGLATAILGGAASAGGDNAGLSFDVGRLGADGLAQVFAAASGLGTAKAFNLHLREGDLDFSGTLKAHRIELAADGGSLRVTGTLDASGAKAGSIDIAAGDRVTIASGAVLKATTDTVNAEGGDIFVESVDRDGDGIGGITVADGATLDVHGGRLSNPDLTDPALRNSDWSYYVVDGPATNGLLAGDVHFRALQKGSDGVDIDLAAGARILGTENGKAIAEAVEVVTPADGENITTADILQWQAQTKTFMDQVAANTSLPPGLTVMPGLEVRGSRDLSLAADWDFHPVALLDGRYQPTLDWRYGPDRLPGFLTLRAAAKLTIKNSLSDGVAKEMLFGPLGEYPLSDVVQTGESWSYRLVAGADIAAASSGATVSGQGDLDFGAEALVRTGTGGIELYAGNNLSLGRELTPVDRDNDGFGIKEALEERSAAIYTVGKRTDQNRFGSLTGTDAAAYSFIADYPTQGGDIRIDVGGDIHGAQTVQIVSDWLVRTGSITNDSKSAVAWGISLSQNETERQQSEFANARDRNFYGFQQNVGTLGGGDVSISSGGSVFDLSVMLPTVGKPKGEYAGDQVTLTVRNNQVEVHGGGDLSLKAGGDIKGGWLYVEKGQGEIVAGGAITGSPFSNVNVGEAPFSTGSVLSLGDSRLDVTASSDLQVGTVFNPFLMAERADIYSKTGELAAFSTYSDRSSVSFASIGGDVTLVNDTSGDSALFKTFNALEDQRSAGEYWGSYGGALSLYPGSATIYAFSGSIDLENSINFMPSSTGNLEFFAGDSIIARSRSPELVPRVWINLSDADIARFPSVLAPTTEPNAFVDKYFDPFRSLMTDYHAATPVHLGDPDPVRISALNGVIAPKPNPNQTSVLFDWSLPKAAIIEAGLDIRNVRFEIQNLSDTDVSQISAGRDLIYSTTRSLDTGAPIDTGTEAQSNMIRLSGPGALLVLAGRNIDLGNSYGIVSTGNQYNPALSIKGGSLTVLAGLLGGMDTFLKDPRGGNLSDSKIAALTSLDRINTGLDLALIRFFEQYRTEFLMAKRKLSRKAVGNMSNKEQLQAVHEDIDAMPLREKFNAALPLFFDQIRTSGVKAAKSGGLKKDYKGGEVAIATLFPFTEHFKEPGISAGDINLYFSRVHTLMGGDINLLAPTGEVNAGVTNAPAGNRKVSDLGIIVQQKGAIQSLVKTNFTVNESRVFTLGGRNLDADAQVLCADLNRCSGDITVWAWGKGASIDAGRGAKASLAAPPPITRFDENGNLVTTFPGVISGSGIRTSTSDPKAAAGDAYLFAPSGSINAGEAGIGAKNITIAATAVIGASNIQATGSSIGVPTTPPPIVVPAAAGSAAASASQQATQQVSQQAAQQNTTASAANAAAAAQTAMKTSIQVDLMSFGNCTVGDIRGGAAGCGG